MSVDGKNLADTLPRLLGLHNLSGAALARLLEPNSRTGKQVTTQYMWLLMKGERAPTDQRLAEIARLFGIDPDRLLNNSFEELLQTDLADPVRFRETEKRIAALKRQERARHDTASAAR